MVACGEKHPEEDVRCQIAADSAHVNHWKKTPWTETLWPNESFVRPSVPTGPQARLGVRAAMVEMSRRLEEPHAYLRSNPHSTEVIAADLSKVKNSMRRKQVLRVISRADGITDDGVAAYLERDGITLNTTRPRRLELEEAGWVRVRVVDGQEVMARTRTGAMARVWELTPSAEAQLHLVDFSDI